MDRLFFVKLRIKETKEKWYMWLAWKMPRTLVMWAAIRLIAHATQGEYSTTSYGDLSAMDALDRWEA